MKSSALILALCAASSEAFSVVQPRTTTGMRTLCRMADENSDATPAAVKDDDEVPLEAVESLGRGAAKVCYYCPEGF